MKGQTKSAIIVERMPKSMPRERCLGRTHLASIHEHKLEEKSRGNIYCVAPAQSFCRIVRSSRQTARCMAWSTSRPINVAVKQCVVEHSVKKSRGPLSAAHKRPVLPIVRLDFRILRSSLDRSSSEAKFCVLFVPSVPLVPMHTVSTFGRVY